MRKESWKFRCQPQCLAKPDGDKYEETCCTVEEHKTKHARIVEADESMRNSMEGCPHKNHEDHIAREGMNEFIESLQFGAQIFLCLKL